MNFSNGLRALCAAVVVAVAFTVSAGSVGTFSTDTVAFYPFDEGTVGEYRRVQSNAVDADVLPGLAEKNPYNTASTMKMSDETPGKYIYSGDPTRRNLVYTDPRSLRVGSGPRLTPGSRNTYGFFMIEEAGKLLSRHHATGVTIEYFFKFDPGDSWYAWARSFYYYGGYSINSTSGMMCLFMPVDSDGTRVICALNNYSSGTNNKQISNGQFDMAANVPGFTVLNDGRWHHFAFVESAGGTSVSFYIDRTLVGSKRLADIGTTTSVLDAGGELVIGRSSDQEFTFGAALSCLRITSRELKSGEFLGAGDRLFPDGTIAAYPFCEKEPGASAVGRAVIRNKANSAVGPGTVTLSSETGTVNPSVVYDSDAPARYLYLGKPGGMPFYSKPQSLVFTSGTVGKSGRIDFDGLGDEISKLHDDGYTFEYFVKFLDADMQPYDPFLSYICGYGPKSSNGVDNFRLLMPTTTSSPRTMQYAIGTPDRAAEAQKYSSSMPFNPLVDGAWHHVAVVAQPRDPLGNVSVSVWIDRVQYGSINATQALTLNVGNPLTLVYGCRYHVKISCVTLRRGVHSSDFLCGALTTDPSLTVIWL